MIKFKIIVVAMLFLLLTGCANRSDYYQAVKEQNITIQLRMENERLLREDRKQQHTENMVKLIEHVAIATGKTDSTTDDNMAMMMIMLAQDKNQISELAYAFTSKGQQLQTIEAPETTGELIQKSTAMVLGLGAITAGILQSNNLTEIATDGMKNSKANYTASEGSSINTGEDGNSSSSWSSSEDLTTTTTTSTSTSTN